MHEDGENSFHTRVLHPAAILDAAPATPILPGCADVLPLPSEACRQVVALQSSAHAFVLAAQEHAGHNARIAADALEGVATNPNPVVQEAIAPLRA